MSFSNTPHELINILRSWFFAKDRDIRLASGRTLITQDGTDVEAALEAQFVTLAVDGDLDNERVLTAGTGISLVDGGAGSTITISASAGVPSGGVIFWPSTAGAIPTGWTTFAAASGRFLVGTDGGTFTNGSTGGAETVDLAHTHTSGTLATDSDGHTHGPGSLDTDNDSHTHGPGSLDTDSDSHTHSKAANVTEIESDSDEVASGTGVQVALQAHTHDILGSIGNDSHDHAVNAGVTASDSHDHAVDAGVTASDSHSHDVDSGATATALSSTQSILPPYLVGTWIEKD